MRKKYTGKKASHRRTAFPHPFSNNTGWDCGIQFWKDHPEYNPLKL